MHRSLIAAPIALAIAAILAGAFDTHEPPADKPAPPATKPADPFSCGTGPTQQMKDLGWLAGTWNVTVTWFAPDGKAYPQRTESTIEPLIGGSFLQERITVPFGAMRNSMIGIRSYDRFRKVFRFVWLDEIVTLADIFEGAPTDDGFSVCNLKPGTSSIYDGKDTFVRLAQKAGASKDEFTLVWEASTDKGETWRKTCEYSYRASGSELASTPHRNEH